MRKVTLLTLLSLAVAVSSFADTRDRHQSYLSYDDGGTIVRSGDDGREIEAHRNLPIYPGDEVVTARRGRTEVRLSDGNIIGVDRATALRFRSILDSYEGEGNETVAELKYGKVAVYRTDIGRDHVRLDTDNASYVAEHEAIYSVESDSRGNDRVTVFEGSVEVRTRDRATRLRGGESATVDDRGAYDLVGDTRESADDFERWFLRRAERFNGRSTKYVDRRLSYWADDLDDHGRWVFVTGIGWSWRPYVAVGWRPYYHGYWHSGRSGCLTWVSYDPWGWGTYHYGRWAFDPGFGWVWVPGYGYSPAWVYWWYGSGYIGWAPAGWWDCHRPYYDWAYRPYRTRDFGFGFYGRVRIHDMDLRPWTFIDSRTMVSTRVDRAALTTDAIKQRLGRSQDGFATIAGGTARFTREEFNDPAAAIRRRGIDGRGTGRETGAPPTDMTPYFRRDGDVGASIRDRIVRSRGGSGTVSGGTTSPRTGGGLAPIDGGSLAPIGRGSVAPIGRGSVAPVDGGSSIDNRRSTSGSTGGSRDSGGRINRGSSPSEPRDGGSVDRGSRDTSDRGTSDRNTSWRSRVGDRPQTVAPEPEAPSNTTPPPQSPRNDSWRSRVRSDDEPRASDSRSDRGSSSASSGSSDVPRRVIDRIGGARVYPRDDDRGSSTRSRDSGSSRERPSRPQSDSGSSTRSSSGSSGSSSASRDSGSSSRSSGGSRDSGGSRSGGGGGRVQRDQ